MKATFKKPDLSTVALFKNIRSEDDMFCIKGEALAGLQRVLLTMMDDIDRICRENGIKYLLSGGSMLGAVRHQGFIPWDDDMDIFLTRDDYSRFVKIFAESMGDEYWLHTPEKTRDYGITLARVRKKGTIVRAREDADNDECGAYVDIFIIENTYDSSVKRKLHCLASMAVGFCLSCRVFYRKRREYLKMIERMPAAKKVFRLKIIIGFCCAVLSVDQWTRLTNSIYSICKNHDTKYVAVPSGRKHFSGEIYQRDILCSVMEADFEGRKYFISQGFDYYLEILYGKYMEIPAEEDREYHVVLELDLGKGMMTADGMSERKHV